MPSEPPARVTVMTSLSTVAGASPASWPVPAGLEPDRVHRGIDHRLAEDLLDPVGQRASLAQVDGLAAEAARPAPAVRRSCRRR